MSKKYQWNSQQLQGKYRLRSRLALLFMGLALLAYFVMSQYEESLVVTLTLSSLGLGVIFMLSSTKAQADDKKLKKPEE